MRRVHPNTQPATPRKLFQVVDLARAETDKLNCTSYGPGAARQLATDLIEDATKLQLTDVPYEQGAPNGDTGVQVPLVIEPAGAIMQFIKAGNVRAVAYSAATRHPLAPEVLTLAENLPGLDIPGRHGSWLPAGKH
ncbi:MAG: hypothetical protein JNM79_20630 [Burkholderiales bacterium]|nr:hypothetical protein [Burkholderiales bacterium]